MLEQDWSKRLTQEEVLWEHTGRGPHARFMLGDRHSGSYFNSDIVFRKSALHQNIAQWFFDQLINAKEKIEAVVARPPYSSRLALPLAELLKVPLYEGSSGIEQKSVLIFADDVYSGGLIGELVEAFAKMEVRVVEPICVIANYSGSETYRGIELLSMYSSPQKSPAWDPDNCPLCKAGSPALAARENWETLVQSALKGNRS